MGKGTKVGGLSKPLCSRVSCRPLKDIWLGEGRRVAERGTACIPEVSYRRILSEGTLAVFPRKTEVGGCGKEER